MPERNIVTVCTIQCSGEPCSPFVLCANIKQAVGGVHWTPALMKLFVLCVCYDVMKIVYSNVAVNFQHLYNLIHHKICTVTCVCSSDHLLNCENSN